MILGNGPYIGRLNGSTGFFRFPKASDNWFMMRSIKLANGKTLYYRALDNRNTAQFTQPGEELQVVLFGEYRDFQNRVAYDGRTPEQDAITEDYRKLAAKVRNRTYKIVKRKHNYILS